MHRLRPLEKDYYLDNEDVGGAGAGRSDDDEDSGSSEDEVQRMFADIAGVQLPSQRRREKKHDRSFEAEMEQELDSSFRHHKESLWNSSGGEGSTKRAASAAKPIAKKRDDATTTMAASRDESNSTGEQQRREDQPKKTGGTGEAGEDVDPALGLHDRGTDSDEEFERNEQQKKGETVCADDLLYDSGEDDANQTWIDSHRRSYQPNASQHRALPKSDAVLNCPACMTVLCLDCQRHEIYKTQYRAMFVMNCDVKRDELLFQPKSQKRGGGAAKKRNGGAVGDNSIPLLKSGERVSAGEHSDHMLEQLKQSARPEDLFYPVQCTVCKTEVGVYDSDEIYHFFNILASYA